MTKRISKQSQEIHNQKYQSYINKQLNFTEAQQFNEFNEAKSFLTKNRVKCIKYNYAFEDIVQNSKSYEAYFYLTEDDELVIINRKVQLAPDEILEVDRKIFKEDSGEVGEVFCPTEIDESLDSLQYKESKSSGSCKVDKI